MSGWIEAPNAFNLPWVVFDNLVYPFQLFLASCFLMYFGLSRSHRYLLSPIATWKILVGTLDLIINSKTLYQFTIDINRSCHVDINRPCHVDFNSHVMLISTDHIMLFPTAWLNMTMQWTKPGRPLRGRPCAGNKTFMLTHAVEINMT